MQTKFLELLVGLFFTLGVAAVFILTFRVASLDAGSASDSFAVTADSEKIGGHKRGPAVTMPGVRIGRVGEIVIDPTTFEARVTMRIENSFNNIPKDSNAAIFTAGLLGEQYIGLSPGGEDAVLADGDKIKFTQSALVLENLIGQFVAAMASGDKESAPANSNSAPAAPSK